MNPHSASSDTIYVPFYKDGVISAGFGAPEYRYEDADYLPFKKQDLRLMFGISNNLSIAIMPCIGNSMTSTIEEGALIVFQQDGSAMESGIYVIRFENELYVKRLNKRPLALTSDNPIYKPIVLLMICKK